MSHGGASVITAFESTIMPELGGLLIKNLKMNKEDLTFVWQVLLESSIEPQITSPSVPKPMQLDAKDINAANVEHSFVAQSGSENSGYDASSEDDFKQRAREKSNINIPLILHPSLIGFCFSVLDQFWENKKDRKMVKSLLSMLKFMIRLYRREENIIRCSENNAIQLILEKNSFVLDSQDFPECANLILDLFSSSSSYHVSPTALRIIINKLTNTSAPIDALTQCLVTLFNKTAKMVSHIQERETISNFLRRWLPLFYIFRPKIVNNRHNILFPT